jgi:hypothetical protein
MKYIVGQYVKINEKFGCPEFNGVKFRISEVFKCSDTYDYNVYRADGKNKWSCPMFEDELEAWRVPGEQLLLFEL